jgi:hypothetical protein
MSDSTGLIMVQTEILRQSSFGHPPRSQPLDSAESCLASIQPYATVPVTDLNEDCEIWDFYIELPYGNVL